MEYDIAHNNLGRGHEHEQQAYEIMYRGHQLVSDNIAALRRSGLSLPESLEYLIKNPPEEVTDQLSNFWVDFPGWS